MSNSTNVVEMQFQGVDIKAMDIDGMVYFLGKQVADVLGYTNPSKALNDHCKSLKTLKHNDPLVSEYGLVVPPRGLLIIPERDVYRLIMRSKLSSAERFEEWVVGEVLPSIRKTGSYQVQLPNFNDPAEAARAWADQWEGREKAELLNTQQQATIEEYRPKVEFTDNYCDADGLRGFRDVCNLLKANEREFRDFLVARGYMYQKGKGWAAYKKHITNGLFKMVEGHNHKANINYTTPMFTPRGVVKLSQEWHRFVLFGL